MPNDRQEIGFSLPYDAGATPYNICDFHDEVKTLCNEESLLPSEHHLRVAKCVVVGDISVGKTCLINRFGYGLFSANYKATIGVDFDVQNFTINSLPFSLQLWDTAGQERFKCISTSYYRGARAVVIVFDSSNLSTLLNAHKWLQEVLDANSRSSNDKPLLFLVGAKKDLLCDSAYQFVHEQSKKVANELEAEMWSVSAQTGENVRELFTRIAALTFNAMLYNEVLDDKAVGKREFATFADKKRNKSFIKLRRKKKDELDRRSFCLEMSCVIK